MRLDVLSIILLIVLDVSIISVAIHHGIDHNHHQRRCSKDHNDTAVTRVAIGFFGVSRNLSSTIGSIERHVFDVLVLSY